MSYHTFSLALQKNFNFEVQSTLANSSLYNNTLGCAEILYQTSSNKSIEDSLAVGLCPDFISVPIVSSSLLGIQIILALFTTILVCIRRNKEPIKARSAFMIVMGILIQSFGVFLLMFRLTIGRPYYPCFIYMFTFICGNVIIVVPYMLRLFRLFIVMRLNTIKLEFSKLDQVEVMEQKDGQLTDVVPETHEEKEFISNFVTAVTTPTEIEGQQEEEEDRPSFHDKDIIVYPTPVGNLDRKIEFEVVPEAMIVKPEAIAPTASEEEGQSSTIVDLELQSEEHANALAALKAAKLKRITTLHVDQQQQGQEKPDVDQQATAEEADTETSKSGGDVRQSISKLLSAEIGSYFSSEKRTKLQKRMKLLQCMIHPLLLLTIPFLSLFLHFVLFVMLELIQIVTKQAIFVTSGSLFEFTRGCGITTAFTLIVGVLIVLHIAMVLILFLMNIRARDTYFIKYEVVIMLLVYAFVCVWFIVSSFIPVISHTSDNFVPYALIIILGPYVDAIVTGIIPMLRTFAQTKKPKQSKQQDSSNQLSVIDEQLEGLTMVLNDSAMRQEFLSFGKRSFCPEFILCWQEIIRYRASKSRKKRIGVFEHVVATFLRNNSALELNLPWEERKKYCDYFEQSIKAEHASLSQAIKRKSFAVQKYLESNSQTFSPFELDELKKQVEFNMVDLFLRFKTQAKVKKFLKRSKKLTEKETTV